MVPFPHMPFWEICSGPVYGGEVDVGIGVDDTDVDETVEVVVGGGGVVEILVLLLVLVGVVLVEVELGVLVGVADDVEEGLEGRGSPSHQPNAG